MGRQLDVSLGMQQRREEIRQHANALELLYLQHNLTEDLRPMERTILRIVGGHFSAGNIRELQRALNESGARDFSGRALEVTGRLDRPTMLALFSYFQQWPSPLLPILRASVYPHISEGREDHREIWSRAYSSAGVSNAAALHSFLYAAGFRDFRNRELEERPGPRMLFALHSFVAGLEPDALSRRIHRAGLGAVPSRLELPRISFPVEPQDGSVVWRRGSYGTHSWRSGTVHRAIDIFAPRGYSVVAPVSGEVVHIGRESERQSAGGNVVVIRSAEGVSFLFSHLDTIEVTMDQPVQRGRRIGSVGTSGGSSGYPVRDPHLHFEAFREETVERRGRTVTRRVHYNPADLFE